MSPPKVLRLAVDADLGRVALIEAIRLLQAAGEDPKAPFTIIVPPHELSETRRLCELLVAEGNLSPGAAVCVNYLWQSVRDVMWIVLGRGALVFSPGGGQ